MPDHTVHVLDRLCSVFFTRETSRNGGSTVTNRQPTSGCIVVWSSVHWRCSALRACTAAVCLCFRVCGCCACVSRSSLREPFACAAAAAPVPSMRLSLSLSPPPLPFAHRSAAADVCAQQIPHTRTAALAVPSRADCHSRSHSHCHRPSLRVSAVRWPLSVRLDSVWLRHHSSASALHP